VESLEEQLAVHYDRVTDAWGLLLGEDLHYGVFATGDEDLPTATAALTQRMVDAAQLAPRLRVLDVGCGTGGPARHLVRAYDAEVLGITPSAVGVVRATELTAAAGLTASARFEERDGTANGLPGASFDRVWVLESSHLMRDRDALISECARVLRPGGRLVLCDLIRRREIPFREVRARHRDLAILRAGFGDAHIESLDWYRAAMVAHGLEVDHVEDLTEATLPTFDRWRANAATHRAEVSELLGAEGLEVFERSVDLLDGFWRDGTFGYGLLSAIKPA
jgi:27-O-demethylrifamycin SV methyltransferase